MYLFNYFVFYWKLYAFSFISSLIVIIVSGKLPITGLYLAGYLTTLIIFTIWITFVTLQNFLQQKNGFNLANLLHLKIDHEKTLELDTSHSIKQLTSDIDQCFVLKWFIYISKDSTFSKESCVVFEEILKKIVNTQLHIDNEVIVQAIMNLYLKHVKEFRRSLKRKDKYGGKISNLYRYSHMCSNSKKAKHYFIHQITINLLNHFINWELGNSLPYQVLVSIISKKVVSYTLNLISNPEFLNYYILSFCASSNEKQRYKLDNYNWVKIVNITENGDATPVDLKFVSNRTCLIQPSNTTSEYTRESKNQIDSILERNNLDLNFEHIIKSEDVKIYEPKSCKTWYDLYDLDSIPLGQDILSVTACGESEKDITDYITDPSKEEASSPMTSAKILFDEVKLMTSLEGIKTSMKPISDVTVNTFHNIRDFQESTVNSVVKPVSQATTTAFHKIGGLHFQDEAAGVMEGILDFGRTKIRKGLRLTGLQDGPTEVEVNKQFQRKHVTKMTHVKSQEKVDEIETTWVNPLQDEMINSDIKIDSDSKTYSTIPSIQTRSHEDGSPELEYEETADLATSIAKLRSLLEQKSSGSNISTPALSPMPPDDFSNKILSESEDIDDTDGVMPSFYKLCAKTATGVIHNTLNTIKTALPGNIAETDRYDGAEKWLFVEANYSESDLFVRMQKLLCERKVFCTVDTAYEALDSLGSLHGDKLQSWNIHFEDELDDFELKIPITKAFVDILCELSAETQYTWLGQEPLIKSVFLLLGNFIEETITSKTNYYVHYWCSNMKIPSKSSEESLSLELEEFVNIVMNGVPDYIKYILGAETLQGMLSLFISSLQIQRINQDVVMQILEIICMKLMEGSKQLSPVSA